MTQPIITFSEDEASEALKNNQICLLIGKHLVKKYPSRNWYVQVLDHGRVCDIRIPEISMNFGVRFKIMDLMEFNLKKAERFAGEYLERWNLTRGFSDGVDLANLNRTANGVIGAEKGDIAYNKPKQAKPIMFDLGSDFEFGGSANA